MGDELVRGALGLDLLGGLADHEGLGLGQEVRRQHPLVQAPLDRVVGVGGEDEVGGDELRALVEQLEEGVLRVGRGLAEEDGAGGVLDVVARPGDGLAVGLHGQLLQVGREAVHVLVERRDQVGLGAEEVGVPDAQQTADDWDVLVQGGSLEVVVHGMGTGQELVEVVVANVQAHRQADGGPDRVSSTHPAFESEHVLRVDAKLGDLLFVGGQGDKVLGNVRLLCGL